MAALTLNPEEQSVVDRVVRMAEKGSQQFGWDHPDISDIVDDLRKAKVKAATIPHGIVVRIDVAARTISIGKVGGGPATMVEPPPTAEFKRPVGRPRKESTPEVPVKSGIPEFKPHKFHNPPFHEDVKRAVQDPAGLIVCGVGPTGSGKTTHMQVVAEELGMDFTLINCRRDMESAGFVGEKTVEPDQDTKASVIKFLYGPVVKAMRTGLDKDGNEVGKPCLLVIDEFPVLPPWLALGFNNLLETRYPRRRLVIPENGGEAIYAHSGFRIVLLGNTIGRGISMESAEYTAQGDALDISTLDRIACVFNYGYSKKAEEKLLMEKIGDAEVVRKMVQFRDGLRRARREQGMKTPLSTRLLVHIADNYRVFNGDVGKSLLYSMINKVMPQERPVYMEHVALVFGIRLEKIAEYAGMDYDY